MKHLWPIKRILHRCNHYKFTMLLIYELFFIFVYPLVQTTFFEWLLHPVTALFFLFLLSSTPQNRVTKALNLLSFILITVIYMLDYLFYFTNWFENANLDIFKWFYSLGLILFFLYITSSLMFHLLRDKEPRADTLAGAASLYLLLGFTWCYLYLNLQIIMPKAFEVHVPDNTNAFMNYFFFSINRLDSGINNGVVPLTSFAQSISLLESILGRLYIAIITARIVGLHLEQQTPRNKSNAHSLAASNDLLQ